MSNTTGRLERKLAAILAADVAGSSRLMSADEAGTLRTLTAHREILGGLVAEHGGRIANTAGDSVLAEFPSVVDAVRCPARGLVRPRLSPPVLGVSAGRASGRRAGGRTPAGSVDQEHGA
jgi:class 3 adenylate cyclase